MAEHDSVPRLETRVGSRERTTRGAVRLWFFADHLGTPVLITNATGSTARRRIFEPFGKLVAETELGGYAPPVFFTGKRYEAEAAMYDFGARWYDATTAAFASVDPVIGDLANPLAHNAYSYVLNRAMNAVDPDGRFGVDLGSFGSSGAFASFSQIGMLGINAASDIHISPRLLADLWRIGVFGAHASAYEQSLKDAELAKLAAEADGNAAGPADGGSAGGGKDGNGGGSTGSQTKGGSIFMSGSALAAFSATGAEIVRARDLGSGETKNGYTTGFGASPENGGLGNGAVFGYYLGTGIEVGFARDFQELFDETTWSVSVGVGGFGGTMFFTNAGELVGASLGQVRGSDSQWCRAVRHGIRLGRR